MQRNNPFRAGWAQFSRFFAFAFLFLGMDFLVPVRAQTWLNDSLQAAQTYHLADSLTNLGQFQQALETATAAQAQFEGLGLVKPAIMAENLQAILQLRLGNMTAAKASFLQLQQAFEGAADEDELLTEKAVFYNYYGNYFNSFNRFDSALQCFGKAYELERQLPVLNAFNHVMTLNNLGGTYNNRGDYAEGLHYLGLALALALDSLPDQPTFHSVLMRNKAFALNKLGEHRRAILEYEQAIGMEEKMLGPGHPNLAVGYSNLAPSYAAIGRPDTALVLLKKALIIFEGLLGRDHVRTAISYANLGNMYQRLGYLDSAFQQHQISLEIKKELLPDPHATLASSYANLASLYVAWDQPQPAIGYFKEAQRMFEAIYPQGHPSRTQIEWELAQLFWEEEADSLALVWNEKTLTGAGVSVEKGQVLFAEKVILSGLPKVLYQRARLALGRTPNWSLAQGEEALQWLQACDEAIRRKRLAYLAAADRQGLNAGVRQAYYLGQRICFGLFEKTSDKAWLEAAFLWGEKSKSLMMLESYRRQKVYQIGGLSLEAIEQEKALKLDLNRLERQWISQKGSSEEQNELWNKILQQRKSLESWQEQVKIQYPSYHQLVYGGEPLSIEELRGRLDQDQALLSYAWDGASVYAYLIQQDGLEAFSLQMPDSLRAGPGKFLRTICDYFERGEGGADAYQEALSSYQEQARAWYQALWQPLEPYLPARVAIIPDRGLVYLPFEALLSASPGETALNQWPFLARDYAISYQYSASLWGEGQQRGQAMPSSLLGVAPSFPGGEGGRRDWTPLTFNQPEVAKVLSLFPGKALVGSEAMISQFLAHAPASGIIHIATHAQIHDVETEKSYLAFGDREGEGIEPLYVRDIYQLQLAAQMVVLSACRSGWGQIEEGEGLISLSRAFHLAGAESLIHSLWQIDDAKTAELMALFYQNLKLGMNKDVALQQARLTFLSQQDAYHAHPFFWSAFQPSGNMHPLNLSGSFSYGWVGLISLLVLVAGGWWWKKSQA
ncbi:MAG: CHAT domain-containing tetratricopeptide repeat protein [Bacteroidota bacterium]